MRHRPGIHFKSAFLAVVIVQALHSLEDYVFQLWSVLAPARYLTGLVFTNRAAAFIGINTALFLFGICCYWWPVRRGWPLAIPVAWLWVAIGLINGIGHPMWAMLMGRYVPGVLTAVLLLGLAVFLAQQTLDTSRGRY